MAEPKIIVDDVSVRFRMSFDRTWTLRDKAAEMGKRWLGRSKPQEFTALRNVSLTVREGEIVGLIGPNGCGKTTLLRTISGIYHPDEGTVRSNGRMSTLLSIGTGFDNRLSGLGNIRLNGLMFGMSMREIEAMIPTIVEFADVGPHIDQPMKYYSSGMMGRVSFAMVLAMQPDIILLDEVFSVGDIEFKRKSERAMHDLLQKASCQVLVSHSLGLIREHCTRAVYMRAGEIVMDGPTRDVVDRYERDAV